MNFKDIELKEKELHMQFEQLKNDFKNELKSTGNPDGVTKWTSNIAIVNSSNLINSWSPCFYISERQGEQLCEYLDNCKTVQSFLLRLKEILSKKSFVYKGETIYLNNQILEKIKVYSE